MANTALGTSPLCCPAKNLNTKHHMISLKSACHLCDISFWLAHERNMKGMASIMMFQYGLEWLWRENISVVEGNYGEIV